MPKKGSGQDGPDIEREPREISPCTAAPSPHQRESESAVVDDTGWAGLAQSTGEVPVGTVLYDSGEEVHGGITVRMVFTAGPVSESLRELVRELMLSPVQGGRAGTDRE